MFAPCQNVRSAGPLAVFALLAACGSSPAADSADATTSPVPLNYTIFAPTDLPVGVSLAVDDLIADLGHLGAPTPARVPAQMAECRAGYVDIAVLGPTQSDLADQEIAIDDVVCGDGHRVTLRGGGLFAAQWAVYAWLEHVGVQYLHPEQTLYPPAPRLSDATWTVRDKPVWPQRSIHAHRTHPIDLSPPLDATGLDMAGYQRRWVDWNVKMRQTDVDGWDGALIGNYAYQRGMRRWAGFSLSNTQQGAHGLIDPDDPRPVNQQLADAIDQRVQHVDGLPDVTKFGFTFGSNEFATDDPQTTLDQLTFITTYLTQKYPGIQPRTINHGTHMEPTPPFGVRFYDLSALAPVELEVSVHMLMFYDLTRSACGVYNNPDFSPLRKFIFAEAPKRRIEYYPESSWWLTFDLPVPLFLAPVSLDAREADFKLLAPLLAKDAQAKTGVTEHHVFSSGQEWGYWLIDYCTAKMTWNGNPSADACMRETFAAFPGGDQLADILRDVALEQAVDMRDPELVRFLVGTDDPTETAYQAGIVFHPLPPSPAEVLQFSDAQAAALAQKSLTPLSAMAQKYAAWASLVDALVAQQDAMHAPWVREVRDGLRIFGLRASHAVAVYQTVLDLRAAMQKGDTAAIQQAAQGVDKARAVTDAARVVVQAREQDYRYPPALTSVGDEPGTPGAIPNATIYPYRYLSRVHRLYYWTRPDAQLAALFGAGLPVVDVPERITKAGEAFAPKLLVEASSLTVDWGDGQKGSALTPHSYAADGIYDWTVSALTKTGPISHPDKAARVQRRLVFAKGAFAVEKPAGGEIVASFLPGFVVGVGTDTQGDFLAMGRIDGKAAQTAEGGLTRLARTGLSYGPGKFPVDMAKVGTIVLEDATVQVSEGSGPSARQMTIDGKLPTDSLVQAIVNIGGFATDGARTMVAIQLGYTPDTLPKLLDFRLVAAGVE